LTESLLGRPRNFPLQVILILVFAISELRSNSQFRYPAFYIDILIIANFNIFPKTAWIKRNFGIDKKSFSFRAKA